MTKRRNIAIRNIKTTLGMEVLRCVTPKMAEKELWVWLLAYNVIRLLMAQAAHIAGVHPRELSLLHRNFLYGRQGRAFTAVRP